MEWAILFAEYFMTNAPCVVMAEYYDRRNCLTAKIVEHARVERSLSGMLPL